MLMLERIVLNPIHVFMRPHLENLLGWQLTRRGALRRKGRFARKSRRGFNLIETTLAVGIGVAALTSGLQLWDEKTFRDRLVVEAIQVGDLADAARRHILLDIDQYIQWTRLNSNNTYDLTLDDLKGSQSYPVTGVNSTVRRRGLSVFLWSPTPTSLIVVTQAQFPDGSAGRVGAPRLEGSPRPIGWVPPYAPSRLEGAGLYHDLSTLQSAGRVFKPGDFVSLEYLTIARNALPYLHRKNNPSIPELTQMETDLDMNGNNLINVGTITANDITVSGSLNVGSITGDVSVLGDVTIEGDLRVSETLNVANGTVLSNSLSVQNASVSQNLTTNSITASTVSTGGLTVGSLVSSGEIRGSDIFADSVTAETLNAARGVVTLVETDTLLVKDKVTANEVITRTLTTGSCIGC